jgi:hypothetical protein
MKFITSADGFSKKRIAYFMRPENSDDAVVTYTDGTTETLSGEFVALAAANDLFIAYNGDGGLANNSKSHRINPDAVNYASYVGTEVTFVVAGAGTIVVDKGNLNGLWNALN